MCAPAETGSLEASKWPDESDKSPTPEPVMSVDGAPKTHRDSLPRGKLLARHLMKSLTLGWFKAGSA